MKRLLFSALCIGLIAATPLRSMAQVSLNLQFNVGDSGYYGQIDPIAGYNTDVIYDYPNIVQQDMYTVSTPLYLRVQPEYIGRWRDYCYLYNACNQYVYFVRDSWYVNRYIPMYRKHYHGNRHFTPRYVYDYHRQNPNRNWNQWNGRNAPARVEPPSSGNFNIHIEPSREPRRGGYPQPGTDNNPVRFQQQTVIENGVSTTQTRGNGRNGFQQQTVIENGVPANPPSQYGQPYGTPVSPYAQQPASGEHSRGYREGRGQNEYGGGNDFHR